MANKKPSIEELKAKAESGDPIAQNDLGLVYAKGDGAEKDLVRAKKLFYKSALQGCADAQFHLGWCYESGKGTETKPKEAFKWYKKAANQQHAEALYSLSKFYHRGKVVEQDIKKWIEYLYKSAETGYAYAQYYLGCMCLNKRDSYFSINDAFKWFSMAQKSGYDKSRFNIGICLIEGFGVKKDIDGGIKILSDLASEGDGNAAFYLGNMYEKGDSVQPNASKMENWYKLSYELGLIKGISNLGNCYENGILLNKDINKAVSCYKLAADKGDVYAVCRLLEIFKSKLAIPDNDAYVMHLLKRIFQLDYNPSIAIEIGDNYFDGTWVGKNRKEAVRWYTKAGSDALFILAKCYRYGYGTVVNEIKSYELMHEAADYGDEQALKGLTEYYVEGIGTKQDYKEAYIVANICHAWDGELVSDEQLRDLKSHLSVVDIDDAEKQAYEQFKNYEPYLSAYKLNKVIRGRDEPEKHCANEMYKELDPFNGCDSSANKSAMNTPSQKMHRSGLDYSSWKVGKINDIKVTLYLRDATITLSYKNKKDTQPADKLFSKNSLRLLILAYDYIQKGHPKIKKTDNSIASAAYPNKDMADCLPNNRVVTYFNSDFRKLFGLAKKDKAFDWDGGRYNSYLVANIILEVKP